MGKEPIISGIRALRKDKQLMIRILEIVKENPDLQLFRIREKLSGIKSLIDISDRTLYRFLKENDLSLIDRKRLLRDKCNITKETLQQYSRDIPLPVNAENILTKDLNKYRQRVAIVRLKLDENLDPQTKNIYIDKYCFKHKITERTVRKYVTLYKREGPERLLFSRRNIQKKYKIYNENFVSTVLRIAQKYLFFTIPQIRKEILKTGHFSEIIDKVTDRTIYRILDKNGLSEENRMRILKEKWGHTDLYQNYKNDIPIPIDAEYVSINTLKNYKERVIISRLLLDEDIDRFTKRYYKMTYCSKHHITEKTVRNYTTMYKREGPERLLFSRRSPTSLENFSPRTSIIFEIAKNHPSFSIPQVRNEILRHEHFWEIINKTSNHTIYRILEENGLSKKNRMNLIPFRNTELIKKGDLLSLQYILKILQCNLEYNSASTETKRNLTIDDFSELMSCIRDRSLRSRNKATVVIAYYEGIPINTIADCLSISSKTIRKYPQQFQAEGIKKFLCNERKGLKKYEMKQYIDAVFSILHSPPINYNINRTSWIMTDIHRIMASKGLKISLTNIRQIIRNAGYQFRKAKVVLTSNDPDYKEKLEEITYILKNLKSSEKFFSIDEYGPCAIKIYGGKSLVAQDSKKTVPQWQKNKGSLICTAALELSTNQITHFYSHKKNTDEMIKLLNILIKQYSDKETIYFSWDAASWHASKKLYKAVDEINSSEYRSINKAPIIKLAPLPSCAQFLNVIESVFSGMARAIIHNSNYQSVDECKTAIDKYFTERNEHFILHPKRAGNKIWGKERVPSAFSESNNCKDPKYR